MASPVAPATEPAAVQQAEPGQAASPDGSDLLDDFNTAFGLAPPAPLNASPAVADPAPEAPVGEPVESEDGDQPSPAPASTPDGEEASEPKLSRRQQAEAERQAELSAAKAEWEAERVRADEAERKNAALLADKQQRSQDYIATMGTDAEFNRLNSRPSSELSYEEQVKLDSWKVARAPRGLMEQDAMERVLNVLAGQIHEYVTLPCVDEAAVKDTAHLGLINKHFHEAGRATERAEWEPKVAALNDEITQLKADNHALRAQRVGQARQPEAGGNSPPNGRPNANAYDPNKSLDQEWGEAWSFPALQRR